MGFVRDLKQILFSGSTDDLQNLCNGMSYEHVRNIAIKYDIDIDELRDMYKEMGGKVT